MTEPMDEDLSNVAIAYAIPTVNDLHEALQLPIEVRYEAVLSLVNIGHRPCLRDTCQLCFRDENNDNESWKITKLLLSYEPRGIKKHSYITHKTALMRYGQLEERAAFLIRLGANIQARDVNGNTALIEICKKQDVQLSALLLLIAEGATPLDLNETQRSGLYYLIKTYVHNKSNYEVRSIIDIWIHFHHFNPEYYTGRLKYLEHPQFAVLKILGENNFDDDLQIIFDNIMSSDNKDIELRVLVHIQIHSISNTFIVLDVIGYTIHNIKSCNSIPSFYIFLKKLLNDYNFLHPCLIYNTITPLTVYINTLSSLKFTYDVYNCEENPKKCQNSEIRVLQYLIKIGCHVAQRKLQLQDVNVKHQADVLCIPDAILIAIKTGQWYILPILLPYWGYPWLCTVLFLDQLDKEFLSLLFPILIQHGGVPHGTKLYQMVEKKLQSSLHYSNQFKKLHQSPLSLQELCRFKVRMCLAKRASICDKLLLPMDLPFMIRNLLNMKTYGVKKCNQTKQFLLQDHNVF